MLSSLTTAYAIVPGSTLLTTIQGYLCDRPPPHKYPGYNSGGTEQGLPQVLSLRRGQLSRHCSLSSGWHGA